MLECKANRAFGCSQMEIKGEKIPKKELTAWPTLFSKSF
jgi:hypothetical protein